MRFVFYERLVSDFDSFNVFVTKVGYAQRPKRELLVAAFWIDPGHEHFVRSVLKQDRYKRPAECVFIAG
jgi:hypothetical protein